MTGEDWKPRPRAAYRRQNMSEESLHLQVWEKVGAVQTIQADLSLLWSSVFRAHFSLPSSPLPRVRVSLTTGHNNLEISADISWTQFHTCNCPRVFPLEKNPTPKSHFCVGESQSSRGVVLLLGSGRHVFPKCNVLFWGRYG